MRFSWSLFYSLCAMVFIVSLFAACENNSSEPGDGGSGDFCSDVCSAILVGCKMQNTREKCLEGCATSINDQRTYCVDLYKTMGRCFIVNKAQFACDDRGAVIMPTACQPAQTAYLDRCYH